MLRNIFVWLPAILFFGIVQVYAQPTTKIIRIGYLNATSPAAISARTESFRMGLRELGYIEGKNIVIDYRHAEGKLNMLPTLAAELVRLNPNVIVTAGPGDTRAAKEATNTIPIVMAQDSDPVANGFVTSLARPGGNITGLSTLSPEISGKRLELLTEIIPRLSVVAVVGTSNRPGNAQALKEVELAASGLKVRVQYLELQGAQDISIIFSEANKGRVQAMLTLETPVMIAHRTEVANLAIKQRIPVIYSRAEHVEARGLMSYGVNTNDLFRRAATYVDKILKGTKPADLPVEQPIKFEFIVNLKAAKQIGVTIPPNVLARADRVIK
jgi:ABC-type uncharacterized transport system substrate-binding protein